MFCKKSIDYKLYLVTDRGILQGRDLIRCIGEALDGGVSLLQLREKNLSHEAFHGLALKVKTLTMAYNVPLIINDNISLAMEVKAAGVHLGPDDMSISRARQILGSEMIIGASANCLQEALRFEEEGADYLGVGALFPTHTKEDAESVSLDTLRAITEAVKIPVVGIGGICLSNASQVLNSGADGIAVVSAILKNKDIKKATAELAALL